MKLLVKTRRNNERKTELETVKFSLLKGPFDGGKAEPAIIFLWANFWHPYSPVWPSLQSLHHYGPRSSARVGSAQRWPEQTKKEKMVKSDSITVVKHTVMNVSIIYEWDFNRVLRPDLLAACTSPLLALKNYFQDLLNTRSKTFAMKRRGQSFLQLTLLHMHL